MHSFLISWIDWALLHRFFEGCLIELFRLHVYLVVASVLLNVLNQMVPNIWHFLFQLFTIERFLH